MGACNTPALVWGNTPSLHRTQLWDKLRWEQNNISKSFKSAYVVLKYDQNANGAESGSVSWTSHWVHASCTAQKEVLHVSLKLTLHSSKWRKKDSMHSAAVSLGIQFPQLPSTPLARPWGAVQLSTAASLQPVLQVGYSFQQKDCQSQDFYLPRSPLWTAEKLR